MKETVQGNPFFFVSIWILMLLEILEIAYAKRDYLIGGPPCQHAKMIYDKYF